MPTLEKFIVPIGPQHPALKEPGHFEFTVDGETVTAANVRLGYVHRGIEKATEDRNWTQNLYLLERICGICSHTHALCYSLGVEALAEVTAPPRAQEPLPFHRRMLQSAWACVPLQPRFSIRQPRSEGLCALALNS